MPISSTLLSSPSWKDYFLKSKNLSYSNLLLEKIRNQLILVPIQIMSNSIKEVKGKSLTFDQIVDHLKRKDSLNHDRTAKSGFNNYNILPIPALLTQVFLELEETDPFSVATAFF